MNEIYSFHATCNTDCCPTATTTANPRHQQRWCMQRCGTMGMFRELHRCFDDSAAVGSAYALRNWKHKVSLSTAHDRQLDNVVTDPEHWRAKWGGGVDCHRTTRVLNDNQFEVVIHASMPAQELQQLSGESC